METLDNLFICAHASYMTLLSTYTSLIAAAPDAVYRAWSDPRLWPSCDDDVVEVRFADQASVGARGWMRPASGPGTRFSITQAEPYRVFTTASPLPGARLAFAHEVAAAKHGSEVTVSISVEGPLAPLWRRILRRQFDDAARRNVTGLARYLANQPALPAGGRDEGPAAA